MRLVFVSHPARGPREDDLLVTDNLTAAKAWMGWIIRHYGDRVVPIAPWIVDCEVAGRGPLVHERGMVRMMEVVRRCDEVWQVGGIMTRGMMLEANTARSLRRTVRDLTSLGRKPPAEMTPEIDAMVSSKQTMANRAYEIEMLQARLGALRLAASTELAAASLPILRAAMVQDEKLATEPVRSSLVEG
jgi:hypothetical protein